jgi:dienelactone hydrolase
MRRSVFARVLSVKLGLLIVLALLASSCCALGIHQTHANSIPRSVVDAHLSDPFEGHLVYVFGDVAHDPPVLLLHELPGFTPQAWRLAESLAKEHFAVYVPLLFGSAGASVGKATMLRVILSPSWRGFRTHQTAPIADMLTRLAQKIHDGNRRPIGVVGMCLTGNLPAALRGRLTFAEAVVVAQPSLPYCNQKDIALSQSDIDGANARTVPFLFFRFAGDQVSEGKQNGFVSSFHTLVDVEELVPAPLANGHFRHATLTSELFDDTLTMIGDPNACHYDPNGKLLPDSLTTACAYDKVRRYLHQRLDGNSK